MKLAIMQPYFFPYIGYFQLINAVDQFVILDDVHFTRKGWTHRNNILLKSKTKPEAQLFSLPLKDASQNCLINEISLADQSVFRKKFLANIEQTYSKAPCYREANQLVHEICMSDEKSLSKFAAESLKIICSYIGINTPFKFSSDLAKPDGLVGADRIIHICETQNASVYINPIGGLDLYSKSEFLRKGMDLFFLKANPSLRYRQFEEEFVPNLSIIDILMFVPPKEINELLGQFTLLSHGGLDEQ